MNRHERRKQAAQQRHDPAIFVTSDDALPDELRAARETLATARRKYRTELLKQTRELLSEGFQREEILWLMTSGGAVAMPIQEAVARFTNDGAEDLAHMFSTVSRAPGAEGHILCGMITPEHGPVIDWIDMEAN